MQSLEPRLLLASVDVTPDANQDDPVIIAKAIELNHNPDAIFQFVRDQIGYDAYAGSLRGARGTLWSGSGNSVDRASLTVALLRASGINSQYAHGVLPEALAQDLILSMFPEPLRVTGFVPEDATRADPANDAALLSTAKDHYWVQYDVGAGLVDVDPSFENAQLGQAFTAAQETFDELPDAIRHKTRLELSREIANTAVSGLFGQNPLSVDTVLEATFNTVELVGKPLSIGHIVQSTSLGSLFSSMTNTYSPYIAVGDYAKPMDQDERIQGTSYQEVLTNFPFGSQILTGLFLEIELTGPDSQPQTFNRSLVDRIGFDIRENGGSPTLSPSPLGAPTISSLDIHTVNVAPSLIPTDVVAPRADEVRALQARLAAMQQSDQTLPIEASDELRSFAIGVSRLNATNYFSLADFDRSRIADTMLVRAYSASPQIVITSFALEDRGDGTLGPTQRIDLRSTEFRVVPYPGQNVAVSREFRTLLGLRENIVETAVLRGQLGATATPISTTTVFEQAQESGISTLVLSRDNAGLLPTLDASPQARARISRAIESGFVVAVPSRPVTIDGTQTTAWFQIDPESGSTVGVTEDGGHQGFVQLAAIAALEGLLFNLLQTTLIITGNVIFNDDCGPGGDRAACKQIINDEANNASNVGTAFTGYGLAFGVGAFGPALIGAVVGSIATSVALFAILGAIDPPVPEFLISPEAPLDELSNLIGSGVVVDVAIDPNFTFPISGNQLPTVYRVGIKNELTTDERFSLSVLDAPQGFDVITSVDEILVPAGATAEVGLALRPSADLPSPGSVDSFSLQVRGVSLPGTSASIDESFVVPEVHGIAITVDPAQVSALPGELTEIQLTIQSIGNVDEAIDLEWVASNGLDVSGLDDFPLIVGATQVLMLNLTPDQDTPLNSVLEATFSASFGAPGPTLVSIPVTIAAPGAAAIANAATYAVNSLGNAALGSRLTELGVALTSLAQDVSSSIHRVQSLANLDSIVSLLAVDPILVSFVDPLTQAHDQLDGASTADEIRSAIDALGLVFEEFSQTVTALANFNFDLFLNPNTQIAQPQVSAQFELLVHHVGLSQATYNVELTGVPAGVTANLSETMVTLERDQFATVIVTLTPTALEELPEFEFAIDVTLDGNGAITKSVFGSLTARREFISVVSMTAAPPFTSAGGTIDVSARLLNAVNRQQQALASFVVRDSSGSQVHAASTPVEVTLTVQTSLVTVSLGTIDTTGLADGSYSVVMTLNDLDGNEIPGGNGSTTFLVGLPLTVSMDVAPEVVAPGTSTVTNTLTIESIQPLVPPPSLLGLASAPGSNGLVRNGEYVYVAGPSGVSVFDVAGNNVQQPLLLRTVGTGTSLLEIRGNLLVAVLSRPGGGSTRLDTYSLIDPTTPTLLGTTGDIPYGSAVDLQVTDTHAFVVLVNFVFTAGRDIIDQNGGMIAINISDPAAPFFDGDAVTAKGTDAGRDGVNDGVLFNDNGTNNDGIKTPLGIDQSGGNQNTWSVIQVSPTILLLSGSTASFGDTQSGLGVVHVVDISDPKNMQLLRSLTIPGTVHVLDMAVSGNVVMITATQGGIADMNPLFPFTGDVVLATLNVSDPANPTIHHQQTLDRSARGLDHVTALGSGLFAISNLGGVADNPGLFLVDATDPTRLGLSGIDVPAGIVELVGDDKHLFTTDGTSLIAYEVPSDEPLTLIGQVPVGGGLRGVAARDDVAYACGVNGIQVIDYSDPDQPVIVGTLPGDHYGCLIQDNVLLALRPFGGSFILDVYALQNTPLSPPLIGSSEVINYNLVMDFRANSTHAFIGQFNVCFFLGSNDVFHQAGDLISIALNLDDVNDPTSAAPSLDNVLFNTNGDNTFDPTDVSGCAENGGDHNVWGIANADSQTVYLATTTVTGGDTQSGTGLIQVVDVTVPTAPVVVRELTIPGTVHALGVGVSGNVGVVIGSTGGFQDNPFDLLTGQLTVTTLDVTDRLNPQVVTSRVLDRISSTFWSNFVTLGNGLFAYSNIGFANGQGNPVAIVIDAGNPRSPLIGQSDIPFELVSPSSLSTDDDFLFTSDSQGVSIYRINPLPGIPTTARVQIPNDTGVIVVPGSFNVPPSETIPGGSFDTYVFDLTLSPSDGSIQLSWQTQVIGMQPGESREVTLGTTVDFSFQGTPGQIVLPSSNVAAVQIIGMSPAEQVVRPGETATYTMIVNNPLPFDVTFDLAVSGVPQSWIEIDSSVSIPAGQSAEVALHLMSSSFDVTGDYGFVVSVVAGGVTGTVNGTLQLQGEPLLPIPQPESQGLVVTLAPSTATAGQGTTGQYTARVVNVGSQVDDFVVFVSGLPGDFEFTSSAGIFSVFPGASNFRDVVVTITPPEGTTPGDYVFTLTAASVTDFSLTSTVDGILSVTGRGVDVELSPDIINPESVFQLLVTNTGSTVDTFDLSLAASTALVATLDASEVTLGPGESQSIPVQIGEINFALPGPLSLIGSAVSRSDAAIKSSDAAEYSIVGSRGLSLASADPFIQLPGPGNALVVLLVDNVGNLQDELTATILGSSGPISASLVGVDGQPAQSIPLFLLPGFSRAAISLDALMTDVGQGQVTVEVRSLLDPSIVVTQTVTVSAASQFDFGDAPDGIEAGVLASQYATLLANNGARHSLGSGLTLGASVDAEVDGQPSQTADGDGGDEDGVRQIASLVSTDNESTLASFLVSASAPAKLDAWIDFDLNGRFDQATEHVFGGNSLDVLQGDTIVAIQVPMFAATGTSYVRFRISAAGGLTPSGEASDGEVEDYLVPLLNGNVGADASVALLVGPITVQADNGDLVVRRSLQDLFRAPGDAIASASFLGTGADDFITRGDLSSALTNATPFIYFGGDGLDTLQLSGFGQSLDVSDQVANQLRDIEVVDVVGSGSNTLRLNRAGVLSSTDIDRTLLVIHNEDDPVMYLGGGWFVEAPIFTGGGQRHVLTNDDTVVQVINTRPWTNPLEPTDVNRSGDTTALDALLIINFLGRNESLSVPLSNPTSAEELPDRYFDTNASLTATALDALNVINFMARQEPPPGGESIMALTLEGSSQTSSLVTPSVIAGIELRRQDRELSVHAILDAVYRELASRRTTRASISSNREFTPTRSPVDQFHTNEELERNRRENFLDDWEPLDQIATQLKN